ncbi:hypothetical protein GCM10011369_27810 [Neiella marina]|uniref:Uncharacterized protein n=1 Tax=Neiella marina TaxID=508461 RepID=A0A8J2U7N6_9GAMM|nr:glycosyltransferase [Neiella marina]GGA84229.1 hypothetical protein GCM10011369_27810 [Neiella marina]
MNVAYVAVAPFVSGSERCLQLILSQCQRYGVSPVLITPASSPLKQWAKAQGITHYSVDLSPSFGKNLLAWLGQQVKLAQIFRRHRISAIHSNQIWSYPAVAKVAKFLKIKTFCHLRDPVNNGSRWWLKSQPDHIICISRHINREYLSVFNDSLNVQVSTLIDPVNARQALDPAALSAQVAASKNQLAIDPELFTFGYIGQVAPVKGVLETISALSKLPHQNWRLLIAGKDPSESQDYLHQCQALVTSLGLQQQVTFVGFLEDVSSFYYACDAIVMLSKEEPLGLIPLEAAMHYTPAIVNAVGGLPETVDDGRSGWVVDANQEPELMATFQQAMTADRLQVGLRAREYAERLSDPVSYFEKLAELYRQ